MIPTSEQVARAVVAALRECGVIEWFKESPDRLRDSKDASGKDGAGQTGMRHARAYAAFALRKAFTRCPSDVIGRCVGASRPVSFLGILIAYRAKGKLRWYDPEVLTRVVEAIGPVEERPEQAVPDEAIPNFLPKRLRTDPHFDRPASKRRLEDELRQAVLNTGGRLAE